MAVQPNKYRGFRVTRGDATGEQLAVLVPDTYRVLHFASAADEATDWNVANPTHPTWYVHSETTPATDYVAISHDGTTGLVTSVGGTLSLNGVTTLNLQVGGTTYAALSATALTFTTVDVVIPNAAGLNVGSATQVTVSDGDGATNLIPEVQALGVGTAFAGGAVMAATFNTTNDRTVSPKLILVKGAAATQVATTAVADNEVVGSIIAFASDSGDFETPVAAIEFVVDDAGGPGASNVGGSLEFYTTADGGTTLTIALTLSTAQLATFAAGIQGNTRADIGITGTTTGILALDGATSGTVSMTVAAAAGTWTFTLPATAGEAGDVLVTSGTGASSWVSGMRSVDVQLTNAQVLALRATPITLVAAPGANRALILHRAYLVCDAAAGAYTESVDNLVVEYSGGTDATGAIETTGFITNAAIDFRTYAGTATELTPVANEALRLFNTGDGEFGGGNAANTLSVRVWYSVVDTVAFT